MLTLLWIIYIACIVAWLIPPLRQYKTKYYYYFIALALADPITALIPQVLQTNIWYGHVTTSSIYIILLLSINKPKRFSLLLGILTIILIFLFPKVNSDTLHNIVAFNILVVSFIIAKEFVVNIKETEKINLFFVILLLYNISGVMKTLFRVSHVDTGYLYFFLTNFFQIFIALYFTFYNVNNSKKIKLFKNEEAA